MQSNMLDTKNETVKKGSFYPFGTDWENPNFKLLIELITI